LSERVLRGVDDDGRINGSKYGMMWQLNENKSATLTILIRSDKIFYGKLKYQL
jgi:hypothetical protein